MKNQQLILDEMKEAPELVLAKEKTQLTIASESSLKKDWLSPEEEEAWKSL
jgi:hypothetical protein